MGERKLLYGQTLVAYLRTPQESERVLEGIRSNFSVENPALDLISSEQIKLIIGLSSNLCWLHYMNENSGYFVPKSKEIKAEKKFISFMYGGHHTEVKVQNCVDFADVIKVAHDFVLDDSLPDSIDWENFN